MAAWWILATRKIFGSLNINVIVDAYFIYIYMEQKKAFKAHRYACQLSQLSQPAQYVPKPDELDLVAIFLFLTWNKPASQSYEL